MEPQLPVPLSSETRHWSLTRADIERILLSAAKLGESPLFEDWVKAVEEYRREHNTIPDIGEGVVERERMAEERDWHCEPLEVLGLSVRPFNCLSHRGIRTVGQLCCTPINEMLSGQSWGDTTLKDARCKLAIFGLKLWDDWLETPIADLDLSPRGLSLLRDLRVTTFGELLSLSADDLLEPGFRETAMQDVLRALGVRGLRLRDGWPRGPQDWNKIS